MLVSEIVLLAFFSIPFWSTNVDAQPPAAPQSTVVRVVAEQFAWNVHTRARTVCSAGRTSHWSIRQPARPRSARPSSERRHHHHQPAEPAGRQAGDHPAVQQGRRAQSWDAADACEAGRGSRDHPAGLVHAHPDGPLGARLLAALRAGALPDESIQTPEQYQAWLDEEAALLSQ